MGAGKYSVTRDGKEVLKDAEFVQKSATVYAVSFRTGKHRNRIPRRAKRGTEKPATASVYHVDDVKTSGK